MPAIKKFQFSCRAAGFSYEFIVKLEIAGQVSPAPDYMIAEIDRFASLHYRLAYVHS
jgi:hypothetical protein